MTKHVSRDAVRRIEVPKFASDSGCITVFDRADIIPFDIARVFVVRADEGQKRGSHAHRQCAQFLTCLNGACDVVCDDGEGRVSFRLEDPSVALLIPPSIWAEQTYLENNTSLIVLCDQSYDEADYIRDYDDFLKWKNGQ